MSLKRTLELNYKERLQRAFEGTKYTVVEGVSNKERPSPVIIVMAGEGQAALTNIPDSLGNYTCDLSVIVMSSIDVDGVDQHNDAVERVSKTLATREARKVPLVENIYLYDLVRISIGEANDEPNRKVGSVFNFKATVNYFP